MTLKLTTVDKLPEISRSGRTSPELNMIIEALNNSAKNNQNFRLDGIEPGNAFNSMQQRIRAQAKKLGYKITIRYDSNGKVLFFKASKSTPSVSTKEVASVTVKNTTKK